MHFTILLKPNIDKQMPHLTRIQKIIQYIYPLMIETFITEVNRYIFQFQLKPPGKVGLVHYIRIQTTVI